MPDDQHRCRPDVDVAVVGAGPVGLTLAALLGQAGHSVVVLERYPGLYGLPRAASIDGETMRLFARLGIADELWPTLHVQAAYQWTNAAGEILIDQQSRQVGDCGWPDLMMFHQPILEQALHARCGALPGVEVRLGTEVMALAQNDQTVTLRTRAGALRARWVVGCDGGNSFVRDALGISLDDLGFSEPWLVCDFKLRRPAAELGLPSALQIGDPDEPTTIFTTGAGHQRFCFMLDRSDLDRSIPESEAWTRVARFLGPDDADVVRVAPYVFRSLIAHRWRDRRILLAGDAAHQSPPFLGQGMCSGLRDAANIAFKLDLILGRDHATEVLDTYQSEREPHVRLLTETAMTLGRQHTLTDHDLARERDDGLRARRDAMTEPDRIRMPDLGPGLVGLGGGSRSPQGRVTDTRRTALLDEITGHGFRLLVLEENVRGIDIAALEHLGVRTIVLGDPATNRSDDDAVVTDTDDTHRRWLREHGAVAAAVRPDTYVLASGPDAALVVDQLHLVLDRQPASSTTYGEGPRPRVLSASQCDDD